MDIRRKVETCLIVQAVALRNTTESAATIAVPITMVYTIQREDTIAIANRCILRSISSVDLVDHRSGGSFLL
jgi:hypothetical protein